MPHSRTRRARSSHNSFSHSRSSFLNSNDKTQHRAPSASPSRSFILTNDIIISIEQANDISSQTRKEQTKLKIPIVKITRECIVCMIDKSLDEFEGIYGNSCVHIERSVCNSCVYENTKHLVEDSMAYFGDITCPEWNCHGIFRYSGIRLILVCIGKNNELFQQYDQHLTYHQLSKMPGFVWCAYGCGSGQLHDIAQSSNPAVTCVKCNRRTCFKHRTVWHTDMTCDQYDLLESQSSETDANNKWLEFFAKQCPKCQWNIQKNEGCDHMTCRYCKHEFCWQCLNDYQLIASGGSSQHKTSCIHYQPNTST